MVRLLVVTWMLCQTVRYPCVLLSFIRSLRFQHQDHRFLDISCASFCFMSSLINLPIRMVHNQWRKRKKRKIFTRKHSKNQINRNFLNDRIFRWSFTTRKCAKGVHCCKHRCAVNSEKIIFYRFSFGKWHIRLKKRKKKKKVKIRSAPEEEKH